MRTAVLVALLLAAGAARARVAADSAAWRVTVVDERGGPLFGVYVVHGQLSRLLTTSDIDGECFLRAGDLAATDTLLFQGVGFRTRALAWGDLRQVDRVVLQELHYALEEVVVTSGGRPRARLDPGKLLEIAASKLKRLPRGTPPHVHFLGRARYEKITEYLHRAVEYRREVGYFFTSGDVVSRDEWDSRFCAYFVPAYSARSYNLTPDGRDTLTPVYMTAEDRRFDAGTRKVFTLLRALQIHGPLFSGTGNYRITPVEMNRDEYVYAFVTRAPAYPGRTRITCRGRLTIDYETRRLRSMTLDYVDYQLYRQVLLGEARKVASPFSTRAEVEFAWDGEGHCYVASCRQETRWKYNLGERFVLVEQPSRLNPARGELVEREAFTCEEYRAVPPALQGREAKARIHTVQRNPLGVYDEELFRRLPPLLDDGRAREELARFAPLEEQFRFHSNRSYYPDNFLRGWNGVERDDAAFRENLQEVRRHFVVLFPEFFAK